MFEGWDSFYLLVGGAGGGLIGLLFVVVSLIRGNDAELKLRAAGVYMSPIVFHLAAVLVLSALAGAPLAKGTLGVLIALWAMAGLAYSAVVVGTLWRARTIQPAHWSDIWCYGVAPLVAYLVLAAAADAVWLASQWAARAMALGLVALLLIAIRNAWDLITWITAKGDELGKS